MTLDVTIGKLHISKLRDREGMTNLMHLSTVIKCPYATNNVCDPKLTFWPKESFRSGSTGLWNFWLEHRTLNKVYQSCRIFPDTNDADIAFLKPHARRILSIKDSSMKTEENKDRLLWLKYWTKKSVELYRDDAAIMFS